MPKRVFKVSACFRSEVLGFLFENGPQCDLGLSGLFSFEQSQSIRLARFPGLGWSGRRCRGRIQSVKEDLPKANEKQEKENESDNDGGPPSSHG